MKNKIIISTLSAVFGISILVMNMTLVELHAKNILMSRNTNLLDFNEQLQEEEWTFGSYTEEGSLSSNPTSFRLKDQKDIDDQKIYKININDNELKMTIVEFNDKNEVINTKELINGSEYIPTPKTVSVGVNVLIPEENEVTHDTYKELFATGLSVSVDEDENYSSDIVKTDFNNFGLWTEEITNYETSETTTQSNTISLRNPVTSESNKAYVYTSSDDNYQLIVNELDSNKNLVKTTVLNNNDTLVTTKFTDYIDINLTTEEYEVAFKKYNELIRKGLLSISIEEPPSEEQPTIPESKVTFPLEFNKETLFVSGKYTSGIQTKNDDYISVNNLFLLPDLTKTLKYEANNNIRLLLTEYNEQKQFIKETTLNNLGYVYINQNTKYISVSFYEYSSSKVVDNNFDKLKSLLNDITLKILNVNDEYLENVSFDQPQLVGEVSSDDISNFANYRLGYYYSWGGALTEASGSWCSRNKYAVNQTKYYFNTNDSRLGVYIQEYDETGKWVKLFGEIKNGESYTPSSEKVKYITVKLTMSQWGVAIDGIWDLGVWINFSTTNEEYKTATSKLAEVDLKDSKLWKNGKYSSTTLDYIISDDSVAFKDYIELENYETKVVRTHNAYANLYIIELNNNNELVTSGTYYDGTYWAPNSSTKKIAISIQNSKKYTSNELMNMLKNNEISVTLNKYEKYNYNKAMKDISAFDLVDNINVGWNLGDSLDSYYGDWGTPHLGQERTWGNITVTEDLIQFVKAQGFNAIRIPVSWYLNTYKDEQGNYKIYDEWISRVQDIVDYAIKNDMYVIMNTHCDAKKIILGQSDEKMTDVYKYAGDLWTEIAKYFKDYDEHLVFESYNEISTETWGFTYTEVGMEQMAKINQIFVSSVRATGGNNTNRVLCIQTLSSMSNANTLDNFVLPNDVVPNKIIVQVHDYTSSFDQTLEAKFIKLESFSNRINAPVIIGESGLTPKSTSIDYYTYYASNFVARAKKHGVKIFVWDNGYTNDYAIIDRRNFSNSKFDVIKAYMNPVAYSNKDILIYNSMSQFTYQSLNQSTGELAEDKYWGTIVTKDVDNHGIEIPADTDLINITLALDNGAGEYRLHYIHFYDENMKLVKAYNSSFGSTNYMYKVPEGAKYVRVSLNSSYNPTGLLQYTKYYLCEDMKLGIAFINRNSLLIDNGNSTQFILNQNDGGSFFKNYKKIDMNNFTSWVLGGYATNGTEIESTDTIRIPGYLSIENNNGTTYKYVNNTWVAMRLKVIEFNSDMHLITQKTITSTQEITLNEKTKYVALSISAPYTKDEVTYDTYKKYFDLGMSMSFTKKED